MTAKNGLGLGMKWVLAGMLVLPFSVEAGELWTDDPVTNTAMVTANLLLVVDWAQTRYGTDRPDEFKEVGFARHFTGEHPTTGDVNKYNATALVMTNVAGYFLPEDAILFGMHWNPKKTIYFGVASVQAATVYKNYEIGVQLQF